MKFIPGDIPIVLCSFKDVFPDKATERRILSKIIKCQNDGCEWTGDLRYKEVQIICFISVEEQTAQDKGIESVKT